MRLAHFAAAAVLAFAAATPALAADPVTVKLAAPLDATAKFIAGGAIFICTKDTCVASSPTSQTSNVSACKEVAKNVGAVSSFGGIRMQFDAAKLEECNAAAKKG